VCESEVSLQTLRRRSSNFKKDSKEAEGLERVLKFYGKEGEKNGGTVQIKSGSRSPRL